MQKTALGMILAASVLGAMAAVRGGFVLLGSGALLGGRLFVEMLPLMFLAFTSAGMISVLISREFVSRWMGREAGWRGLFLGAAAGAVIPGGGFVFYPIAATFFVSGADIGTVISFITAKTVLTVSRLPIEVALIGPHITFVRYVITFPVPILLGAAAQVVFAGYAERIRAGMEKFQGID